ncbi:Stf0 family sulfotransferase [Kiloniella spongiae]|uniref:Stf0 family sulfotransferase n=1 Tax=Kiloniella spongiae TaxID=1489064 RepID=UPI0009E1A3CC|nr:Stf0 family sulfotransferase [Kiloniella spongiae]
MIKYQSYIICTSPRSGSTLLCKLLAATGKTGNPNSHFHVPEIASWVRDYGVCAESYESEQYLLRAIFAGAKKRGIGQSDMFGLRMQRGSFLYFVAKMKILYPGLSSDLKRIEAAFGNTLFIYLTRENKIDQAVSFVKAEQTGLWHLAPDGTELERLSDPQTASYDENEIKRRFDEFSSFDQEWKSWFVNEGIEPLRITYDELSADPKSVLSEVLDKLNVNQRMAEEIEIPVAKLADGINRDWIERFLGRGK